MTNVEQIAEQIKALAGSGELPKEVFTSNISTALNEFAQLLTTELQTNADAVTLRGFGKHIQLQPIKVYEDLISVDITAPEYWRFIEYGVTGFGGAKSGVKHTSDLSYQFKTDSTYPATVGGSHAEAIKKWVFGSGLFGGAKDYDTVAYLVTRNIKRTGIEPKRFARKSLKQEMLIEFSKILLSLTDAHVTIVFGDKQVN